MLKNISCDELSHSWQRSHCPENGTTIWIERTFRPILLLHVSQFRKKRMKIDAMRLIIITHWHIKKKKHRTNHQDTHKKTKRYSIESEHFWKPTIRFRLRHRQQHLNFFWFGTDAFSTANYYFLHSTSFSGWLTMCFFFCCFVFRVPYLFT